MKVVFFLMLLVVGPPFGESFKESSSSTAEVNITSSSTHIVREIRNLSAAQKWLEADKALRAMSSMAVKSIIPQALRASENLNISSECSRGLFKFLMGIKQTKLWAFRMLDSFGKIPNGLLSGGFNALGEYDECIETDIPGHSQAQYCTVAIVPPLPPRQRFVPYDKMIPEFINLTAADSVTTEILKWARNFYRLSIRSSVCVPSTCSRTDVELIVSKVVESMKLEFHVSVPNCETKNDKLILSSNEIAVIIVLSTLLFVVIVATVADVILKRRSSEDAYAEKLSVPFRCLLCFSLYRNLQRLLKRDSSPESIKIFHGLKTITILWVILCHTYLFQNYHAMNGLLEARVMTADFVFQVVINGFLCVQVFFFISAVLSAYGVMKVKEKNLNILMFILRRIWRLAPPFMLVIACVFLIPHLGSGPVWKETVADALTEKCRVYWWTNLVFISNFVPLKEMCLRWTWYIPVDTQLYIISLIVLIPLKKNSRQGLIMNAVLFLAGIITSAVFHIYYKLNPTTITVYNHPDDISYATDYGYHRTYLHCGTYCVGLTVGYILATKPKIRIPLWINIFGWTAAFALGISIVYGAYDWQQGDLPSSLISMLYASTHRSAFALALAWLTISCMTGHGGVVASFLSWEGFVPLGRLTYMTYLIHPIVHFMYIGSTKTLIRQEHRTMVFLYLANVTMSFICAVPLSLLFESPFLALERIFISSRIRADDVKNVIEDNSPAIKPEWDNLSGPNGTESNGPYVIDMKEINLDG